MKRAIVMSRGPSDARAWPVAIALLLVGLVGVCPAGGSVAEERRFSQADRDALFEKAFGRRPSGGARQLDLPITVDDRPAGETASIVTDDPAAARFRLEGIRAALAGRVIDEVRDKLTAVADDGGFVTLRDLNTVGLEAALDFATLRLIIRVPVDYRPIREFGFGGQGRARGEPEPPATVSAFLNFRSSLDYVHAGVTDGRQPLLADFDTAVRLGPVVLQGDVSYNERAEPRFRRGGVRAIHDDPERVLRYAAGDISYPVRGFQRFLSLGGVAVARNFSLQPYRVTTPSGRHEFTLLRESLVEVLLNGRRVSQQRLAAGRYDFRDFPLSTGLNQVQLRIIDPVRGEQVIDLDFHFDNELLLPGLHEFAYAFGVPSSTTPDGFDYETRQPVFSAFHRYGLNDTVTLGANGQADEKTQALGGEVVWATPWGNLLGDGALSLFEGDTPDFALEASHVWRSNEVSRRRRSFAFGLGYTGSRFATIGSDVARNSVALDGFARFSQGLTDRLSLGVGAAFTLPHGGGDTGHRQTLDLSYNVTKGVTLRVRLEHDHDQSGDDDYGAFLTLQWRPGSRRDFFRASHDTLSGVSNLEWQHLAEHGVRDLHGGAVVTRDRNTHALGGNLDYDDYRAEFSARHDVAIRRDGDALGEREQRSSLRLGTALVFADGVFAISRPVTDSFAIVVPHPNLAGRTIDVGGTPDHPRARVDALGPAVVHDITSYQRRAVTLGVPDLPFGYDIGSGTFLIEAPFNSGTVIRIGTDATVLLDGIVQDRTGAPVALVVGEARRVDDGEAEAITFFTNRKGRFRIDGLRPGGYRITLARDDGGSFIVEVPEDTVGLYKIGIVTLE